MSIVTKLAAVREAVSWIAKDARNDFHRYDYTSAAAVFAEITKAMHAQGLAVCETTVNITDSMVIPGDKWAGMLVTLKVTATVRDADTNETATFEGLGQGGDKNDKAVMKAATAAWKYLWAGAFQISWGDDPEAGRQLDEPERRSTPQHAKTGTLRSKVLQKPAENQKTTAVSFFKTGDDWRQFIAGAGSIKGKKLGVVPKETLDGVQVFLARHDPARYGPAMVELDKAMSARLNEISAAQPTITEEPRGNHNPAIQPGDTRPDPAGATS